MKKYTLFFLFCTLMTACPKLWQQSSANFSIDEPSLKKDLEVFTASPHPFGSDRQKFLSKYILDRALSYSPKSEIQPFTVDVPNPSLLGVVPSAVGMRSLTHRKNGWNIYSFAELSKKNDCVIILGSHYDTKIVPGIEYVGANDSGSSSALLIQMLRFLKEEKKPAGSDCELLVVWFDGEEAILDGWDDGEDRHPAKVTDNTYGSRHFVSHATEPCVKGRCLTSALGGHWIKAFLLVDMIGSPNLKFSDDQNSDETLRAMLRQILRDRGLKHMISTTSRQVADDHIPFKRVGIPSLNIIDFENLDFWHRRGDELSNLSFKNIELSGSLVYEIFSRLAESPKPIR